MVFTVDDSLLDDLIFSMEDQQNVWYLDAQACSLVPDSEVAEDDGREERYYLIPSWTSADGYDLLEDFTNNLHSPQAHAELRRVLVGGRGVFRNFKNVLKKYPEVERKWHFYKEAKMKARVMEWYNSLRESWGLERLAADSPDMAEDTEELLQNDFMFQQYECSRDWPDISAGERGAVADDYEGRRPHGLAAALAHIWQNLSDFAAADAKNGIVCRSLADELSGCILVSPCPPHAHECVVLTDFFVLQNYRGLGIGRALLRKCLSLLQTHGVRWFLIANTVIPEAMEPLLIQCGFERLGAGFVADLAKE